MAAGRLAAWRTDVTHRGERCLCTVGTPGMECITLAGSTSLSRKYPEYVRDPRIWSRTTCAHPPCCAGSVCSAWPPWSCSRSPVRGDRTSPVSGWAWLPGPAGTCAVALAAVAMRLRGWLDDRGGQGRSEVVAVLHGAQQQLSGVAPMFMAALIISAGMAAHSATLVPSCVRGPGIGLFAATGRAFEPDCRRRSNRFLAFVVAGFWIATVGVVACPTV